MLATRFFALLKSGHKIKFQNDALFYYELTHISRVSQVDRDSYIELAKGFLYRAFPPELPKDLKQTPEVYNRKEAQEKAEKVLEIFAYKRRLEHGR